MRTVAIVQARTGSNRLPGKVLMDLAGEPMVARVVRRLRRARALDDVWIATTTEPGDDALAALCMERGWPYVRGTEQDVLDRYHETAHAAEADVIVRITSDCPLIDPDVVDAVVEALDEGIAYSSNIVPVRTFPRGLDTEAFRRSALEEAWAKADTPSDREHVTPFLWRQLKRFSHATVTAEADYSHHRWTVDTKEDYALVQRIYERFGDEAFGWRAVLELLEEHPEWYELNAHVEQKVL